MKQLGQIARCSPLRVRCAEQPGLARRETSRAGRRASTGGSASLHPRKVFAAVEAHVAVVVVRMPLLERRRRAAR